MEGRNVSTIRGKSHKQGLTSAMDLPIELFENLTYNLIYGCRGFSINKDCGRYRVNGCNYGN